MSKPYVTQAFKIRNRDKQQSYEVVEDVLLVDVNGDERLVFCALVASQFRRRFVDEFVEDVQELLVGRHHDLLVRPGRLQRRLRVASPDHLDAEQPDL